MGRTRDDDFESYLHARQATLLRTAYLLTGDTGTAEDVVQTALAKLYLAWDKVREQGAIDAYARRIVVNECHSLWRRPWRRREITTATLPESAAPEIEREEADEVWRWVATLPPRQRAVIVLRYYEQLTEAEIAAALSISEGTVKSQASRALAALRTRVPESMVPDDESVRQGREEER